MSVATITENLLLRRRKERVSGYIPDNAVRLIKGGEEYFSLLEKLIDEAKHTIHLQTYIFDADQTGRSVIRALVRAAHRNVHVSVLVDGYASQRFPIWAIELFHRENIQFQWFYPLFRSRRFYFGRRLHHKVFVADARKVLVGGLNISDRYNDTLEHTAWLDWAVYAEGNIGKAVFRICDTRSRINWHDTWKLITREEPPPGNYSVRVRINDWVNRKMQIWNSYMEMFRKAKSRIIIMSPYFIPGKTFRAKMCEAAKRGVSVSIILGQNSDVLLARYAEKYLYPLLLRNGVRIFEYKPNILHGKIATYDGAWATVGSYNINNLSAFASVELNLDVENEAFAGTVDKELTRIIERDCQEVTASDYQREINFIQRFLYRSAYDTIRILYFLFTINFKQRD